METSRDLLNESDVKELVSSFYSKLMKDEMIGVYFTEVVRLDLKHHLPVIESFWNSVLFGQGDYRGNPILKHIELHRKRNLERKEFNRWLELWAITIDAHFSGPKAEEAKSKAITMAELMLMKIVASENEGFIQ